MDICIRFHEDRVETENTLFMTAIEEMETIKLDAKQLTIRSVRLASAPCETLKYRYNKKKHRLLITPDQPLKAGETIAIRIASTCFPSENVLEGIYRDTTPKGRASAVYVSVPAVGISAHYACLRRLHSQVHHDDNA